MSVPNGGEATQPLVELLGKHLDIKAELSDPFRTLPTMPNLGRRGQWDIAVGMALRQRTESK